MNIHGFKKKKKRLNRELRKEKKLSEEERNEDKIRILETDISRINRKIKKLKKKKARGAKHGS